MVAYISRLALRLFGWKVVGEFPEGEKYVVLAAPHTSGWDFVWGRLYYNTIHKSVKFMINEKFFFFPLNIWIRSLGAIPVKQGRKSNLVDQMVKEFQERDGFLLTITPEGTRSRVKRWKRGFYHIAMQANVSIVMGFIDYEKKELGVSKAIKPTGNIKEDMEILSKFYENITAKFPENYNKDIN
jgi:1-acyl-sn-glycerol-3-phosphate acyltransferase